MALKARSEKLFYLAHPYSGDEGGNFELSNLRASKLIASGLNIYSPISHTHPLDQVQPQPWEVWLAMDKLFVNRCDGLILSPGWEHSRGCKQEKKWFEEQGKPVFLYTEIEADIIDLEQLM